MLFSPPLAFGFAVHSVRRAKDRWASYLAIVLSALELIAWLVLCGSLVVALLA